jgi:hypothetical protein
MNRSIVALLNIQMFHIDRMDYPGWWLYVAVRFLLVSLLVWLIWRFPTQQRRADAPVEGERLFEPLMGLRAMACLMVLMGHFFRVVFPFSHEGVPKAAMLLLSPPWAGVWLFFALSGYLMGKDSCEAAIP